MTVFLHFSCEDFVPFCEVLTSMHSMPGECCSRYLTEGPFFVEGAGVCYSGAVGVRPPEALRIGGSIKFWMEINFDNTLGTKVKHLH